MKSSVNRVIPNKGQAEALALMRKFLRDKEAREFCLNGSGGTGKTTIIKELFLKEDKHNKGVFYVKDTVIGSTVSHRARLVLQEHLPNCTTYAAAVNMTVDFDDWGEMIFIPKTKNVKQSKIYPYKYIVFDEASMVSSEMREILLKCCNPKAKIIYLGDHCQLPPIKPRQGNYDPNVDSPVFDLKWKYTLTEKMRQTEGDYIAELCDTVREHIDGDKEIKWIGGIKSVFDKETNKGIQLTKESAVIKSFINNFRNGIDCKILAYRNSRINDLNFYVRKELFPETYQEKYVTGDLIVGNDMYAPNEWLDPVFYNGEDMIVKSAYKSVMNGIKCDVIWAENKDTPIYIPSDEGAHDYRKKIMELKEEAMETESWDAYMEFKSKFANISYGYAVTLYKIQGTTLYGVYMDIHDIFGVKPLTDKRKLQSIYVGFSRPTNFLAIF